MSTTPTRDTKYSNPRGSIPITMTFSSHPGATNSFAPKMIQGTMDMAMGTRKKLQRQGLFAAQANLTATLAAIKQATPQANQAIATSNAVDKALQIAPKG